MRDNKSVVVGNIEIDKFTLHYQIEGNGIPTLVIGSAIYYPRTFSVHLREHLQFIFIDHRGFGKTIQPLKNTDYTFDKIIDDIEQIRKMLDLPRVIIVGHSGHGYMALQYAKKYPHAISHVVLLAMSPDSSAQSFAAADRYFQESVCPERKAILTKNLANLPEKIAENPRNAFITRMLCFAPMIWYDEYFDASYLWRDVEIVPEILDYYWGKVFREIDIKNDLDQLNVPVFLGLGRYDYWNPPYLWENLRHYFKDLTIRIFEKSAHTPQLEEQKLFDHELLQWLTKQL